MKCFPVNNCFGCPNYDHSGAFTPGGAIPLCNGVKSKKYKYNRRELPYSYDQKTGKRVFDGKIPNWCPLPNK